MLNCERSGSDTNDAQVIIDNALQYADKAVKNKAASIHNISAVAFSLLLLAGIVVCSICDLAITGNFTWSLFPITSIVFAWLLFFPVIKSGIKGIYITLASLSVFIIPFLYVLNLLIENNTLIMPIGIRMAVISVVFLWIISSLFNILKSRKFIAAAVSLLLAIPVCLLINYSLSVIISEPLVDLWDIFTFSILLLIAIAFFAFDFSVRKTKLKVSAMQRSNQ